MNELTRRNYSMQRFNMPQQQWWLFIIGLLFSGGVNASKVYKCVAADGAITYSGVRCSTDARLISERQLRQNVLDTSAERALALEKRERERPESPQDQQQAETPETTSALAASSRRLRELYKSFDEQIAQGRRRTAATIAAQIQAELRFQEQLKNRQNASGPAPSPPSSDEQANHGNGAPLEAPNAAVIHDEYGRPYVQQPGSSRVMNIQTGKYCTLNGQVIVHCD